MAFFSSRDDKGWGGGGVDCDPLESLWSDLPRKHGIKLSHISGWSFWKLSDIQSFALTNRFLIGHLEIFPCDIGQPMVFRFVWVKQK